MGKYTHITFDYELFFGSYSGTVHKCMIEPTNRLIEMGKKHKVKFVFFVDAGYLFQLRKHSQIENCLEDHKIVSAQIKELHELGHEIALHVHPHWEDSFFEGNAWKINTTRYKLADFKDDEITEIVSKYHREIISITGQPCKSYRAGGWCIQPFSKIKNALEKNNIFLDSSVYKNGHHAFTAHSYDFRNAPAKTHWQFENNECLEVSQGKFTEVAITEDFLPPTFYMELYLKMKLNPSFYKPIGDGSWLKDKKRIYKQFYSYSNHFACCDGFFASRLKKILLKRISQNEERMLVLGHPKSMANCSFKYLDEFISFSVEKGFNITTLHEVFKK